MVKILILQFFHVRCCFSRNGNNISKPPSWTTHQTSMLPPIFEAVSGKKLIPFGTINAMRDALIVRTVCRKACQDRLSSFCLHPYGHPRITVFGFNPPKPVVWTLSKFLSHGEKRRKIFLSQNILILVGAFELCHFRTNDPCVGKRLNWWRSLTCAIILLEHSLLREHRQIPWHARPPCACGGLP